MHKNKLFWIVVIPVTVMAVWVGLSFFLGSSKISNDQCFSAFSDEKTPRLKVKYCTAVIAQEDKYVASLALQARAGAYTDLEQYQQAKADLLLALETTPSSEQTPTIVKFLVGVEALLGNADAMAEHVITLLKTSDSHEITVHDILVQVLKARDPALIHHIARVLSDHDDLAAAYSIFYAYDLWTSGKLEEVASFLKKEIDTHPAKDTAGIMPLFHTLTSFCEMFEDACPSLSISDGITAELSDLSTCELSLYNMRTQHGGPTGLRLPEDLNARMASIQISTVYIKALQSFIYMRDINSAHQVIKLRKLLECAKKSSGLRELSSADLEAWNDFLEWIQLPTQHNNFVLAIYFSN